MSGPWKHLMMCRPRYFAVKHRLLNAHMTMEQEVSHGLAVKQWDNFYETLQQNGVKVELVEAQPDLVDMVFSANAAIIFGNKSVIANFGAAPRVPESEHYVKFFKERNFEVIDPATEAGNVHIEGCGDFMSLYDKSHHFVAHGFRSDPEAFPFLKKVLSLSDDQLSSIELVNKFFYHIDTCLTGLSRGHLMYYPKAFSEEGQKRIEEIGDGKCIRISDEDAFYFACNSVNFEHNGEHIIIGNKFSEALSNKLADLGYKTIETPFDQFLLSGGSTRCCVLDIGR
eukprot:gene3784-4307_t